MTAIRRAVVLRAESLSLDAVHCRAAVSLRAEPFPIPPPGRPEPRALPIRGDMDWQKDPVLRHADMAVARRLFQ